jgi:hypothetical protein
VKDPVHTILIVCCCKDVRDDKLSSSSNNDRVVTEVGVLEENARILLMNTNSILDSRALAGPIDECSIHIVDSTLAITTKRQAVGHVSSTILTKIERMLSLMRMLWVSVRNNHFCKRQSVEYRSDSSLIIICDVVQHNSFLVVESNMNIPILPRDNPSLDLERNPVWLCNIDRLDILSVPSFRLNACGVIVIRFRFAHWSTDFWDIDMDDFLRVGVEDRAKVEGK